MNVDKMKTKFNEIILSIIDKKRDDNKAFLNNEEYQRKIFEVKNSKIKLKTPGSIKTVKDYRNVGKFDVMNINGKDRLIRPVNENSNKLLYYTTNEELFDILHSVHLDIGHGGRNRMCAEIKNQYANVTKETVMVYLRLCAECQKKSSHPKRGLVVKPILHSCFNSRAQIDLIDMQSQSFNDFRFIMNYQDHLTKFVQLRALKTKSAKEVASALLEIYLIFGAPAILHSDNGREFVNAVITELHTMWDGIKIVHGKPRHSQSQGSIERANRDVEEMLGAWLSQNQTADWPSALKFIQFQKNRALHSGIGRSPYEAMFGCSAKVGLKSFSIPQDEILNVHSEEDVTALLQDNKETEKVHSEEDYTALLQDNKETEKEDSENQVEVQIESESGSYVENVILEIAEDVTTDNLNISELNVVMTCTLCSTEFPQENLNQHGVCQTCIQQKNIMTARKRSRECLEQQAKKMLKLSHEKFSEVDIGTTVRVPIPDVDRARGASRNILAVITDKADNIYKLITTNGLLKHKYTRAEFNPCKENLLKLDDISDNVKEKEISLREAAACNTTLGKQGYKRCQCKTKCNNKKCACRNNGLMCNSKCHGSLPCSNKVPH